MSEMESSPLKRAEDSDPSCRPRLTAEQTAYLEEYFAHTPRPTTMQKRQHAEELGLTQEKVNNWFQNRRAKSKQQNRSRQELSILTPDDPRLQQILEQAALQYSSLGAPFAPLQFSQLVEPVGFPTERSQSMPSMWQEPAWPSLDSLPYSEANVATQDYGTYGVHADASVPTHSVMPLQQGITAEADFSSASSAYQDSLPEYALDPSSSAHSLIEGYSNSSTATELNPSSLAHQSSDGYFGLAGLQDQVSIPFTPTYQTSHMPEQDSAPLACENLSLRLQAMTNNLPHPTSVALPQSPSSEHQSCAFSDDAYAHQDSSPAVAPSNGIPMPFYPGHPNLVSNDDGFRTPVVPDTNLASRRKRPRPANIISMRATSASNFTDASPRSKTANLPMAVRRIKSTGNNLSMYGGRVQKPGTQTPVRSPLTAAFFESLPPEDTPVGTAIPAGESAVSDIVQTQVAAFPDLTRHQSWTTSPSSLGAVPPLSASFTQNSFEESLWFASPPITPFFNPAAEQTTATTLDYLSQLDFTDLPQSAPAHISAFNLPNTSPPVSAHLPGRCSISHPVGSGCPTINNGNETTLFAPQPVAPATTQLPSHMARKAAALEAGPRPSIARPTSSGSGSVQQLRHGQYTFYAAPPAPPPKELEVVMAEFPTPAPRPEIGFPRSGEPHVFTFQNSYPNDYANNDD